MEIQSKKVLGLFSLVMMNVIAVDSLRSLPMSAEYGLSLVTFYLVAIALFFIPSALVASRLGVAMPQTGGIYNWVKIAFGQQWGLIVIWMQWIFNVVWFPTILVFITSSVMYFFDPALADNRYLVTGVSLAIFWIVTGLNSLGVKASSIVSIVGSLFGTLVPMCVIIGMGILWLIKGYPSATELSWKALVPHVTCVNDLSFFVVVIFSLLGLEMSAIHAGNVIHPEKNFPRAVRISMVIIALTLMLSALSVAVVVKKGDIRYADGLIQSYKIFFNQYGMSSLLPVLVVQIVVGSIACLGAWLAGPSRALMVAAKESGVMGGLFRENRYGVPGRLFAAQSVLVTLLSLLFILIPSLKASYWLLSSMTSQLALASYVVLYLAALKLEQMQIVQFGKGRALLMLSVVTCLVAIVLGFAPPTEIEVGNGLLFCVGQGLGMVLLVLPAVFLMRRARIMIAR